MRERCIGLPSNTLLEDCDISYSGKYFKFREIKFPNFFVYAWRRDGEYLYFGQSGDGERRFQAHEIIKLRETDYIDIWICLDRSIALKLETEFIRYYKPKFNKLHNPNFKIAKITKFKIRKKREIIIPSEELMQCKSMKELKELKKKYK